jgi:hypothetical protein
VANIVRRPTGGHVRALPLPHLLSLAKETSGRISFLKVDVEGVEIAVIRSAQSLFEQNRVRNMVVEFGPPSRWINKVLTQFLSLSLPNPLSHISYFLPAPT